MWGSQSPSDERKANPMTYCEDYPCCGHTPENPCGPQWYDQPGAFDTSRPGNQHALCDHENGDCEVDVDVDDDEVDPEDDPIAYREELRDRYLIDQADAARDERVAP